MIFFYPEAILIETPNDAPNDKKAVQEDQNSNCSAGKDTEADLTAT